MYVNDPGKQLECQTHIVIQEKTEMGKITGKWAGHTEDLVACLVST